MSTAYAQDTLQLVVFKLHGAEYGIEILQVQEIIKPTDITRVPHAPAYVKGVINLRGSVIPVIDLKARLSLARGEDGEDNRIVITKLDDVTAGLAVDAVTEVLSLPTANVENAPGLTTDMGREFISGVGKLDNRLIILLNLPFVLGMTEKST